MIIIGSQGFIGSHFKRAFPDSLSISKTQLDLKNPTINFPTKGYQYAIIAAGIGNPKKCEAQPDESYLCNVVGTIKLGKELLKRGVNPIFFSSDYIFDNTLSRSPLNVYGRQKVELENLASQMDVLVIRLSKVYGLEKGDNTLFDEMAASLSAGIAIRAAHDQVFAPVFIGDVINRVVSLIKEKAKGIVNVAGPSYASRLEMATYLAKKMGASHTLVESISLDDLNDGVQRPKFLKITSNFSKIFWQEGIEKMVKAYAR